MRRFPRLRVLVTAFAVIGFTAALGTAASGPAHAAAPVPPPPVFNNLPPITAKACVPGSLQSEQQPCQVVVADGKDIATFTTGITAHTPGYPTHKVSVTCNPSVPGDPLPPIGSNALPVGLQVRLVPPPYGVYQYSCTATDSVTGASSMATVSLTALDQPAFVHTPGFPYPSATADATDTATVSYPTITASEAQALTGGESDATTNDATFNGCFPVGPGPTSATSGDVPPFLSSGTFPLGVTTLYCTATDTFDGQPGLLPAYQYQKVTVADQPVTLTVPGTQLAQATSSSGGTVSYGPLAAEGSEAESVGYCSADKPAASSADGFVSGGNFPVGGTTLTCYATDLVDGTSAITPPPQSFTVIITNTPCAALAGCNLHGLDLSNAILAGADLSSGTDLSNANLNEANLSGANLSFANLSGTNLNQADLTGANLTGAITTGANFNKVTWSNTTCPDGTNSSASTPETCVGHL
jgi:hypothetical protein